jgi:xylose isomerase
MRTYLLLKERATAFRADPEVQKALEAAGVLDLRIPTIGVGETSASLLADPSTFEDFDADAKGQRPHGATRLDQLALEHLLGAR